MRPEGGIRVGFLLHASTAIIVGIIVGWRLKFVPDRKENIVVFAATMVAVLCAVLIPMKYRGKDNNIIYKSMSFVVITLLFLALGYMYAIFATNHSV